MDLNSLAQHTFDAYVRYTVENSGKKAEEGVRLSSMKDGTF